MKTSHFVLPIVTAAWLFAGGCAPIPAHVYKVAVFPDQRHFRLQNFPAVPYQLVDNTIVLFKKDYT
ncbi:MAG: hypothetical protein ACXVCH_17710, partial [Bdellovibrionota bacterium]